jgi:hypothetical protein
MLDEVIQDGFDGVYLDWVEAWEMTAVQNRAQNEGKNTVQEMLNLINEIRNYGKQYNPDFIVIQQNSSELINEVGANALKKAVDAIAQEGVWWDGIGGNDDWSDPEGYDYASCCTNYYLARLRKYKSAGFPVFVIDYAVKKADEVYQKAAAEGFIAYATRRSLSKLTTTPPDFVDINPPQTPVISIDKTRFYFGALAGANAPGSRSFTISNSGAGTLNWSIIDNAAWLSSNPTSGTGSAQVTVSIDITGLNPGAYTGTITVSDPNASNSPQTVEITLNVYEQGADNEPFGSFDTPADGSSVRSSVAVTGWVLDDIGIDRVEIYRGGENRQDWIYIGDAVLVEGARTDIEQTFPTYPMNHKAGWGYMMLTNFLPNGGNGIFTIYARATDTSGHSVTLGSKTITCDNANAVKPFGAIDTPTQGGIASGSNFVVWGWALTPWPNTIPTNGSTINVYVDSVSLGHPGYNIYRPDIAGLFPSYANSNGAAGYFILDTTTYENGVHTIQWVVTDGGGNTDGIGSRYFVIQNSK